MDTIKLVSPGVLAYALVRVGGYVAHPKPYLWWHGLVDLGAVSVLLFVGWLKKRGGEI